MEHVTQSTTSGNLFKLLFAEKRKRYEALVDSDFKHFIVDEKDCGTDIRELLKYKEYLSGMESRLDAYVIPTMSFDVAKEVNSYYSGDVRVYNNLKETLKTKIEEARENDKLAFKKRCDEERAVVESTIAPIRLKHDELLSMKTKLIDVMEHYGISPSDTRISPDISRDDFEQVVDASLLVCRDFEIKTSKVVDILIKPLQEDDAVIVCMYSVFVLLLSKLALPLIGGYYLYKLISGAKKTYDNLDKLKLAESLMYSVDFDRFIPEGERYVEPVYDSSKVDEVIDAMSSEVEEHNPTPKIMAEIKAYTCDAGITYISEQLSNMVADVKNRKTIQLNIIRALLNKVNATLNEEIAKQKKLGSFMNKSAVMNTNFLVGYVKDTIPVYKDFGLSNLNIVGTYSAELISYLKVMYVNMLMNVRANCLEVCVYDEEYLGQSVSEFITKDTLSYITIKSKEINKVWEDIQKKTAESILALKTDSILDYNKRAEDSGMLTRQYYLYILLTGLGDKLEDNKPIMELMKYSAEKGIIIWTVYNKKLLSMNNITLPIHMDEGEALEYTFDIGGSAVETFTYDLKNNKIKALALREGYIDRYLPREKWWTGNTTKGINIRLGLENGDPSKAFTLTFNDGNVHMLMAGATGSGKSVAIDTVLQCLIHEYPPDELVIVYIDLKNAEVRKYIDNGVCTIPHVVIAAGTTDGDYCLSILEWAYTEMIRRINVCGKYKQQKVEDLRKKYDDSTLDGYDPEVHIPRMIILIDEFQVMFNDTIVSNQVINKITGQLTACAKLARAASMHLWFTSQSMQGTLPPDALANFSMRAALRCTKEVSAQVLGNEAAGTIRDKVGWIYSNDTTEHLIGTNKLWKIPYGSNSELLKGAHELNELAEKEGKLNNRAAFYDETEQRTKDDLLKAYSDYPILKKPNTLVLGERTVYSTNPKPLNFSVENDDKENIVVYAFERQDCTDIIGTLMDNILLKDGKANMLINSADKDTVYLLDLEKYMPEGWEDFLGPNRDIEDILEDLEDLCDSREESGDIDTPLFIFCIMWEKLEKIGVNENYKAQDRLTLMIKRMNNFNIHCVFISRDKGLPTFISSLCNHKIFAKLDETTASRVSMDPRPAKLPGPTEDKASFAIYEYGGTCRKFKIYRHVLERVLEAREL